MAKVKYMGVADVRSIPKGTDFDGRLADPIAKDLVFDRANRWTIDTDELGLSAEAVELLLAEEGFKDVSDLKVIPSNDHQMTFLGHKKSDVAATEAVAAASDDDDQNPSGAGGAETPVTTVGGSTSGAARGGGRRGAAGT